MLGVLIVSAVLTGIGLTLVSIFNYRSDYTDDNLGVIVPSGTVALICAILSGIICPFVVGTCWGFLALVVWAIVAIVAICLSQFLRSRRLARA